MLAIKSFFSILFILTFFAVVFAEPSVEVNQFQTPILKLKKDNPVLRIKIYESAKDRIAFSSLHVSLNGCDDLGDIKAVRLYYSKADPFLTKSSKIQIGTDQLPAATLTFQEKLELSPDECYLWLTVELADDANLHHKIDMECDRITFSDGLSIQPEPLGANIKQRIGVAVRQQWQDGVHTYRIPGLSTTNDGTLLAVYDVRRNSSRDLQGDIDIGLSRSTDGGNTWEPMQLVLDMGEYGGLPQKFNGVSDPAILVDENSDKIYVAALWSHGVLDENGQWIEGLTEESDAWEHQWQRRGSQPGRDIKQSSQFLYAISEDDGQTWSSPVNITATTKPEHWWLWAPAPGRGLVLNDGTLIFPSQGRDETGYPFSNITYSTDGGQTWTTSAPASSNTTECQAVQLKDGSILLNIRDNRNRDDDSETNGRAIYITQDLGKTWSEHPTSHNALIESTCMASLHRHNYIENGVEKSLLLFSNPNTKKGRHHTTIKVSFDDGQTWPEKYWFLLDEGNSAGYSCLTSIDKKTIGILYEGSQAHLTFESIPLDDLLKKSIFGKE